MEKYLKELVVGDLVLFGNHVYQVKYPPVMIDDQLSVALFQACVCRDAKGVVDLDGKVNSLEKYTIVGPDELEKHSLDCNPKH